MLTRLLDLLVNNAGWLRWVLLAAMGGLVIADLLIPTGYDRFVWESWGGFGALFGVLATLVLVVLAKGLGFGLAYRAEDYYDDELERYRALDDAPDERS